MNSKKDYRYDMETDTNDIKVSYMSPVDEFSE